MHIRYRSEYGSTKQYAEELTRLAGTTAEDLDVEVPDDGQPVVYMSFVHGPVHPAASKASESKNAKVAVVTVGMSPLDEAIKADHTGDMVPASVKRFYLPGRLEYSRISAAHKATLATLVSALRLKPRKTAVDRNLIDTYGKDTDRVDFSLLTPILEWGQS